MVSDSVRPQGRQPTRLPSRWDSPGKNTGVGCHFLLQCMKSESEVTQSYPTLSDPMDCSLPASSINGIFQQEYWRGVPLPSPQLSYFTDFRLFLILPSIHSWQLSSPSFLHLPLLQECESRHVADTRDVKVAQSCPTLCDTIDLYSPWDSPGHNTGVGNLFLLQGIFRTQGSNPCLPHCRRILYQLSHKGSRYT